MRTAQDRPIEWMTVVLVAVLTPFPSYLIETGRETSLFVGSEDDGVIEAT